MPISSRGGGNGAARPGITDRVKWVKPKKGTKTVSAVKPIAKKKRKKK